MDVALSSIKQAICERIAQGETVRRMSREEGMPSRVTIFRWLTLDPEFSEAITHAYQCAGSTLADEVIDLARETENTDKDKAMSNRVAMDGLKWAASKFYPKMFGSAETAPRTQVNVVGDVQVVCDEPTRKAMIAARQRFLKGKVVDGCDMGHGESETVKPQTIEAEVLAEQDKG